MRGELLQVARHGEKHRRRDLVERLRQVLDVLAEVRHEPRKERQRDRDVAAENMAERQIGDGAVRLRREQRVVLDEAVCGGEVRAVGDERALRVAGGAGGVDDESRGGVIDCARQRLEVGAIAAQAQQLLERAQPLVAVGEHRRIVDDHDVAQSGKPIGDRANLVDVLLVLGDENGGAAVAHLVFDLGERRSRVQAIRDGARSLRAEIGDHPFLTGVAHDGDPLARPQAEPAQPRGAAGDILGVLPPGDLLVQAEALRPVGNVPGRCTRTLGEHMQGAFQLNDLLSMVCSSSKARRERISALRAAWVPPPCEKRAPADRHSST